MMKKMMGSMKQGKRIPGLAGMPALASGGGGNVAALKQAALDDGSMDKFIAEANEAASSTKIYEGLVEKK